MTDDNVWTTEDDLEKQRFEYDEKRTGTDWSQVMHDFSEWLDQPAKRKPSRFHRFMTNWFHIFMTVATGGLYFLGYGAYYFYRFAQSVEGKDYEKTKYIRKVGDTEKVVEK